MGYWKNDEGEIYTDPDELYDAMCEALRDDYLDEVDFENWIDDVYNASNIFHAWSNGEHWEDYITEYEDDKISEMPFPTEGEDYECDYGTFIWYEDDEDEDDEDFNKNRRPKTSSRKTTSRKAPAKKQVRSNQKKPSSRNSSSRNSSSRKPAMNSTTKRTTTRRRK